MKKFLAVSVTLLSIISLAACSSSGKTGDSTVDSNAADILTVEHEAERQSFDKVTLGTTDNNFAGGTNLETAKSYFGQPSSSSQEQAGDATLEVYEWTLDDVSINMKFYNDSAVVKSISNFAFVRDAKVGLSEFKALKTGTSYDAVVKKWGSPDSYSVAVSSDVTTTQAVWTSNLKNNGSTATVTLDFENGSLTSKTQQDLAD
ncbi:DUF3862 domain-containing protein [Streptococcus dentiloxodontae]